GVTEGTIEAKNLKLIGEVPDELLEESFVRSKMERDRQRLIDMMNYAKSSECRRELIYKYFGLGMTECGNCDNCRAWE
ncbi:MAG: ATP-dependent DNA helicase, partial [Spirochaetae bacterium HGW-Spirochaetae-5]